MYAIGYTTGTFDDLHYGHRRLLETMKNVWCEKLVVGLTTDELAVRQKRRTSQSFEHRRATLCETGLVDAVVAHRGDTKLEAYQKLGFNVLLIGDDYFQSPEYVGLPFPVRFIPRTPNISSSQIMKDRRTFPLMIASSLSGPIMQMDETTITKFIRVGQSEQNSTADVYNFPIPRPRNWKRFGETHIHPNITGVNSNREINIHTLIADKEWNPVRNIHIAWQSDIETTVGDSNAERTNPSKIFIVSMDPAGMTMFDWWPNASTVERGIVMQRLHTITREMLELGVIHNDLHPKNICVDLEQNVSIIDFGWVLHHAFEMKVDERAIYEDMLNRDIDWEHLMDSMEYEGWSTDE